MQPKGSTNNRTERMSSTSQDVEEKGSDEAQSGTGVSVGDFDLGVEIIDNKIKVLVLKKMVDRLMDKLDVEISDEEMESFMKEAIDQVNNNYSAIEVGERRTNESKK